MDSFWHDAALLLAIDLVLFGLVWVIGWIDWSNGHGEAPLWLALPCALAAVVAHVAASGMVLGPHLMNDGMPLRVGVSVVCGLFPVIGALWMLCTSWVSDHAHSMHGWNIMNTHVNMGTDLSRARSMKRRRDVVGALRQYRRYFNDNPVCPRPLFEAELMLESERCYDDALDLLREILRHFGDDDVHWVEAVYRLSHVLEIHYHDFETSHYLLRKIMDRCPDSDYAAFALRLLRERDAAPVTVGAA